MSNNNISTRISRPENWWRCNIIEEGEKVWRSHLSKPYHRASSFVREKTFITAKNGFSLFISYHMRTKWSLHWFSPRRIGDVPIINFWALSIEKETGKKSSGTHTATRAVVIVTWHMIVAFYTTITTWSGTICKSVECEELTSCQKSWFLLPRYKI